MNRIYTIVVISLLLFVGLVASTPASALPESDESVIVGPSCWTTQVTQLSLKPSDLQPPGQRGLEYPERKEHGVHLSNFATVVVGVFDEDDRYDPINSLFGYREGQQSLKLSSWCLNCAAELFDRRYRWLNSWPSVGLVVREKSDRTYKVSGLEVDLPGGFLSVGYEKTDRFADEYVAKVQLRIGW